MTPGTSFPKLKRMHKANTKRTPKQLHEVLATKYLFGWADTKAKARALWLALTGNAAELDRETSQASQDRARESRVMAAKVRRLLNEMGGAVAA